MPEPIHLTVPELEAGLPGIRQSPTERGRLCMIVMRPQVDRRQVLVEGELTPEEGLVGDNWRWRPSSRTPDHSPHPDMQLALVNARLLALIAPDEARWHLAGDQLVVDLDLSEGNLPVGSRLALGTALIEITGQAHTGCAKFAARFGEAAFRWVNSQEGRALRLRGVYARVIQAGKIRVGEVVSRSQVGYILSRGKT